MTTLLLILSGVAMVVAGIAAVLLKDLIASVVSVGLVSLFASIVYLLLAAPDVAMTEAAIGAGLSTVIFLYAVQKTQRMEVTDD